MMRKVFLLFCFWAICISVYAKHPNFIRIKDYNGAAIKTQSGQAIWLFQGETFEIDSDGSLKIFDEKLFMNRISGDYYDSKMNNYPINNSNKEVSDTCKFDVESEISVRKDDDSLYIRIKPINGFSKCHLINQEKNKIFGTLNNKQQGSYYSYSLEEIQLDSNSILRIAPIGFYSFLVHWNNIKGVTQYVDTLQIDTIRHISQKLSITKTCYGDTIKTYVMEKHEDLPNTDKAIKDSFNLSYIWILLTIVLGMVMWGLGRYWKLPKSRIIHNKFETINQLESQCSNLESQLKRKTREVEEERRKKERLEDEYHILRIKLKNCEDLLNSYKKEFK